MKHLVIAVCLLAVLNCALAKPSEGMKLKELRELLELVRRNGPPGTSGEMPPPSGEEPPPPSGEEPPPPSGEEPPPPSGEEPTGEMPPPLFDELEIEEMKTFCLGLTDADPMAAHNLCFLAKEVSDFFDEQMGSQEGGSGSGPPPPEGGSGEGPPPPEGGSGEGPPPADESGVMRMLLRLLLEKH